MTGAVPLDEVLGILRALGVRGREQSGFWRFDLGNGHRMYVAKNERCSRIDLAGPLPGIDADGRPNPGYVILGEGRRIGAVRCQIDFSQTPEVVAFAIAGAVLAARSGALGGAPAPARGRVPLAGRKRPPEAPVLVPEERRELVRRVAQEMGVGVSPDAFGEDPSSGGYVDQ